MAVPVSVAIPIPVPVGVAGFFGLLAVPDLAGQDALFLEEVRVLDELRGQPPHDVVRHRLGERDLRVAGDSLRVEPHVAELLHEDLERHPVLEAERDRRREGVHHAPHRRAFLADVGQEDLADISVLVLAGRDVSLVAADRELVGHRLPGLRHPVTDRSGRFGVGTRILLVLGVRPQGLGRLRAVAVDRERLQAAFPAAGVGVSDVLDRRRVRHVDRLRDRPRQERLGRSHHVDVAGVRDRPLADRDVEHRQVLLLQARGTDDRVVLVDVALDLGHLGLRVTQGPERHRHRLVDDRHRAAADQLLELDQREVRLDPGRVAVHQEADRSGRGQHRRLGVAVAVLIAEVDRAVPLIPGRLQQILRNAFGLDLIGRIAMHPHYLVVRLTVLVVGLVRTHRRCDLGRPAVTPPGHHRRDRGRQVPTLVRVVRHPLAHQESSEVCVAEAELAEPVGVLADPLGRVARESDHDLLGEEDRVDHGLEAPHVERAVLVAELHQVDRGQVAGRVVHVHVFRARVRRVDPARVRAGVPTVDRRVVLDTGIGALPRGVGDLVHQVTGREGPGDRPVGPRDQVPLGVVAAGLHEVVRYPDRVVGVLVLDRGEALAVDRHVEAGVPEGTGLLLLVGLAPDEVLDVGVVDVEHDHLGRPAGLAARLDRAGPGVGPAHEADRTGSGPALRQVLDRATDVREIDARAGAAPEDHAFLGVPIEDRLHRVLDAEDEAGRALGLLFESDVEPDRRVEGCLLVEQDRGQLGLEGVGILVAREVAALATPSGDRSGHPADHLLDRGLALVASELAPEVFLGDDVRRVLRPGPGELDSALLEGRVLGITDDRVPQLPLDLVEGVDAFTGQSPFDGDSCGVDPRFRGGRLGHALSRSL